MRVTSRPKHILSSYQNSLPCNDDELQWSRSAIMTTSHSYFCAVCDFFLPICYPFSLYRLWLVNWNTFLQRGSSYFTPIFWTRSSPPTYTRLQVVTCPAIYSHSNYATTSKTQRFLRSNSVYVYSSHSICYYPIKLGESFVKVTL